MTQKINTVPFVPAEPITYSGKVYNELVFKRPKASALVAMDAARGDVAKTMAFLAALAGVPIPVIHELDVADLARLGEEIRPLVGQLFGADVPDVTAA